MGTDTKANDPKPSAVEGFKEESNYLLGPIPEELADENDFFGKVFRPDAVILF